MLGKLLLMFLITWSVTVNGSWSDWTSWTDCSESCEGGIQYRSRFCDNPRPNHDGLDCVGSDQENRPCNQQQCPRTVLNIDKIVAVPMLLCMSFLL